MTTVARAARTILRVGDWYEIGVALGLGLAAGLLLAGALAGWRYGLVASVVGALTVGVAAGLLVKGWLAACGPGSLLGGVIGAVSASLIARGALRRGATPGGTAFLIASASIAVGLLALVPVAGYVLAVLVPALAARRARNEPDRHAGLRTLAK